MVPFCVNVAKRCWTGWDGWPAGKTSRGSCWCSNHLSRLPCTSSIPHALSFSRSRPDLSVFVGYSNFLHYNYASSESFLLFFSFNPLRVKSVTLLDGELRHSKAHRRGYCTRLRFRWYRTSNVMILCPTVGLSQRTWSVLDTNRAVWTLVKETVGVSRSPQEKPIILLAGLAK